MRQDQRGAALVEFAMVAPVLVGLALPLVDIGMGFYYKTRLMTATEAGAQYAFVHGWDTTNIKGAVTSATGLTIATSDITVTLSCKCVDPTTSTLSSSTPNSPTSADDCNGASSTAPNCPNMSSPTQKPGAYVTVTVTPVSPRNYQPLFNFQGLGAAVTMTASSTVRIQ